MTRSLALLALLLPTTLRAQEAPGPAASPTAEERVEALATLWKEASYNFAYFDQIPDLDWDARFVAYLPEIRAAGSTFEFYRVLQRFLAELHDGHTMVFFPDSIVERRPIDFPWVSLREVERRAIVVNADTLLARRLPPGSEILAVDGVPVPEYLERHVFPQMAVSTEHVRWRDGIRGSARHMWGLLAGAAGSEVRVDARTPDGREVALALTRDRATRESRWAVAPKAKPMLELRQLEDGIAYVALNTFNEDSLVERFDSIFPVLLRSRGVVLDVRRNGGGRDHVVRQILARLSADSLLGPAWRTRTHVAAYRAWGRFADTDAWAEEYRPYWEEGGKWTLFPPDTVAPAPGPKIRAPIAVLIGQETQSSAENFLIYIHGRPGVTLVGQPTVGSSGQPLMLDLPGGGRAWICTKRNTYPDGRPYIGTGVIPDVAVPVTVEDLRAERDRTLETALRLLREQAHAP